MALYRYSRWDGTQNLPPFDADDVLEALGDDVLAEGDIRRALQRLMQRGMSGRRGGDVPGIRQIMERLRAQRQAELEQSNLGGVLDEIKERLDRIIGQEAEGIERRLHDAEQQALDAAPGEEQDQARMGEQVLRRTAQQRRDRLDALPKDVSGRMHGLRDYEFMDPDARDAFNALSDELRQQMLETYFQGLKEGVQDVTPEDLAGVREMVKDLNELLEKHASGADTPDDFIQFMAKHGQYFPPGIENVDQLIDHMHRQASQMASLLNSMSPQMRSELQQMMDDLLRDDRLRWDMARLAGNLQALRPDQSFGEPYPFSGDEPMGLPQAMAAIDRQQRFDDMEQALAGARDPDALDRIDSELLRDLAGDQAEEDLDQLRELTRALEEAGYLERDGDRLELTPRGNRRIGQKVLDELFSRLDRDAFGGHRVDRTGHGGEREETSKPFEFGDPFHLDLRATLSNALMREENAPGGRPPGTAVKLRADDFEVYRTEHSTSASTVLLVDMSRSMLLRDCYLAAKKVAIALDTLIRTQYPRDSLAIVGFAYYARELRPEALAELSWHTYEYGTNLQHGLLLARRILARSRSANKEIVVITDGEPTAHFEDGQVEFSYPPTRRTIQETLREVVRCTKEGITINTFMLDRTPALTDFIGYVTELNRGRAFYAEPENLGEYVLVDFVKRRTQHLP
jgi:uncharacterized protein with von Willebrand factor type A (vWA) domain